MGNPSDSSPNFDFLMRSESSSEEYPADAGQSREDSGADMSDATQLPEQFEINQGPENPARQFQAETESSADSPLMSSENPVLNENEELEVDQIDEESVFSDYDDIPEPDENISDGLTLIMQNGPNFEKFTPLDETFEEEEPTQRIDPTTLSDEITTTSQPVAEAVHEQKPEKPTQSTPADSTPNFSFLDSAPKLPIDKESNSPELPEVTHDIAPTFLSPAESQAVMNSPELTEDDALVINEIANKRPHTPETDSAANTPLDSEEQTRLDHSGAQAVSEEQLNSSSKPAAGSESKPEASKPAMVEEATFMGVRQGLVLILLASYASAITLLLIMLLMKGNKTHQLESLPDVIPEAEGNLSYVPVNAVLPPGHTLKIGDSERYGNLKVEVLKITREPITFVHYNGDTSRTKAPTTPVWKLWLKFTNVSEDQTFSPIDRDLTLRWITKAEQMREFSNYYIFAADNPDPKVQTVQMYRLPKASDWDMQFQNLGKELQPGESTEAFIATSDEQPIDLAGQLLWRFQLRKGISPSGHGVTTMVEVAFKPEDVVASS